MTTEMISELDIFEYLDELKASGSVDMLDSVDLLSEKFDISNKTSVSCISRWILLYDYKGCPNCESG